MLSRIDLHARVIASASACLSLLILTCCSEVDRPSVDRVGVQASVKVIGQADSVLVEALRCYSPLVSVSSGSVYVNGIRIDTTDEMAKGSDTDVRSRSLSEAIAIIDTPISANYQPIQRQDPGRKRYYPLLTAMYGRTRSEVERNLVNVEWIRGCHCGPLRVTKVNGVDTRLCRVVRELNTLPAFMRRYLCPHSGGFNYRVIAGTETLSTHAFGIAVDINARSNHYWRYDASSSSGQEVKYHNSLPMEIVRIFEKYGFLWGGRWYHFDTMHFEYRPELFVRVNEC